jgi:hypothetical protein
MASDRAGWTLPTCGFPHSMLTTQAETINADLLAFLKA